MREWLEKLKPSPWLGKKLLITGGGRCNVTNAEFDNKKLLAKFKESGKFLASPFAQWSVQESLDFFHARNMLTKEEAEQYLENRRRKGFNSIVTGRNTQLVTLFIFLSMRIL